MISPSLNIVLVEPEIPPNTGSIARLCGATNSILHLVKPLGFSIDDRHLKRAGLDYWPYVQVIYWDSLTDFLSAQDPKRLHFLSKKATRPYTAGRFQTGDYFVFGKETLGLPEAILTRYADQCYLIPMSNPHIRSLNLAMAAGIVIYEALRQLTMAGPEASP